MHRNLETVSTRCQRIAELAKQSPQMGFTSLNHHIDLHWLHEACLRTRKDGEPKKWSGVFSEENNVMVRLRRGITGF